MASPQLEDGAVHLADDLFLSLARSGFTGLERQVIDAVIYLTYSRGVSKAEIATEDIRYLLGAGKNLRTDRIASVLVKLIEQKVIFRQELVNGKQLLGVQKDYDKWLSNDKMSPTLQGNKYINNINNPMVGDKMSLPERLLAYAQRKSKFRYSVQQWRAERKVARELFTELLADRRDAKEALYLIKDYIDTNDWMRDNVKMQFTFMAPRFDAYLRQIPRKPRDVREDEETLGKRYRYNVNIKRWEVAPDESHSRTEAGSTSG